MPSFDATRRLGLAWQDMRFAVRSLRRQRGLTVAAVLSLSIGGGLNTAIFSIVDGVLLRPFPYTEPERIVVLRGTNAARQIQQGSLSWPDVDDARRTVRQLSGMAASLVAEYTISDGTAAERYPGAAISWNLFPLLGVTPTVGSGFTAADDQPGAGDVVLLSHELWSLKYGANPTIVGRTILIDGRATVVVGVMPEGFAFPYRQRLWIPIGPGVADDARDTRRLTVYGRLAANATLESAQTEVATFAASLEGQFPLTNRDWGVMVESLRTAFIPRDDVVAIWMAMAATTLVLFIACSNVANLLLARATARRRELSIRTALGADRWRILRQLLTEHTAMALLAVPPALLLAHAGSRAIYAAMPVDQVPYYITWSVEWRALAYTVGALTISTVFFGLLPSLQVTAGRLTEQLKDGVRANTGRTSWVTRGLVVVQLGLASVALVGAVLLVRTFTNLNAYDLGFNPSPLLTMRLGLAASRAATGEASSQLVRDIVDRITVLPGVESAVASNLIPLAGGSARGTLVVDGGSDDGRGDRQVSVVGVAPRFHATLGVGLEAGRELTDAEAWARSRVAIVNETLAERFWPGGEALDGRVRLTSGGAGGDWLTVIGVAPDVQHDGIASNADARPALFMPLSHVSTLDPGLTIRVGGDPETVAAAVREQIREADPNIAISAVRSMDELRRLSFWRFAVFGWLFGVIGLAGLALAATGVYGVMANVVSQQVQEIGVRLALGAGRGRVIGLIVGHGGLLTLMGIAFGGLLSVAAMPALGALLYDVSPFDPVSYLGVSAFLAIIAMGSSYLPALRAARVDPAATLRGD